MNSNILWLPSWYPNLLSPLDGDFIKRHAISVSAVRNITVVYLKKDDKGIITNNIKKVVTKTANLEEIIIYYHPLKTGTKIFDRLLSVKKYDKIYRSILKKIIQESGLPSLIHVHVALNVSRQALWLKKKYSIPILISEHWTGYLPEAKPNLDNYNPLYKIWLQKIFTKADAITVVSRVLGEAITRRFDIKKFHVIPNVVDTEIFFPIKKPICSVTKFIHVSLLNYQKNSNDIIEAFKIVKDAAFKFQLTIYGPANILLKEFVRSKNLEADVTFKNEVTQNILAKDMQQSDALVLYSRYETFGCVVIEANACGIPVILTDLPVFREYIIENKTGVFAKPNSPKTLANKIINFIRTKNSFSQKDIANYTRNKFCYQTIANQFEEVYKIIIK